MAACGAQNALLALPPWFRYIFYCQTQLLSVIAILFNFNCLIDEADSFYLDWETFYLNGVFDDPAPFCDVLSTVRYFR